MTLIADTTESIAPTESPQGRNPRSSSGGKRKAAPDASAGLGRARSAIEKLEEQNQKAASTLQSMTTLWLSADAKRRRGEAEMALNHFDAALIALRKSLAAT